MIVRGRVYVDVEVRDQSAPATAPPPVDPPPLVLPPLAHRSPLRSIVWELPEVALSGIVTVR